MIDISPEDLVVLTAINAMVNQDGTCTEDPEPFRPATYTAFPENMYPNCKDRALEKIRKLVECGWARAELRLTLCWTRAGDDSSYHAVVSIDTPAATLILDAFYARPMDTGLVPYEWCKRERPGVGWVLINKG